MNRAQAEIVSGSDAGSLVPISSAPTDMLLIVMICSRRVTSSALGLR